MNARVMELPGGDPGTALTIAHMRRLIECGKKDPVVRELAAYILRRYQVPAHNPEAEAKAIGEAVYRNVRFTGDVRGVETLQEPRWTIALRIGDCDDFVTLICALLESIGHRTRIVTVAAHPDDPSQFSHVYPETRIRGRWIAVDFARRDPSFGKAPEHFFRKRIWEIDRDNYEEIDGLGMARRLGYNPKALPGAYRIARQAEFRNLRGSPFVGQGHYGLRGLRGLGDGGDGFDWAALTDAITAGSTGAANIITAERAAPQNLYPTTTVGGRPVVPYGYDSVYATQPFAGGISSTTLLLGVGVVAAIALASRRG